MKSHHISFRSLVLFFLFTFLNLTYSHSGRTDKYGGHNNRKTGGYHYHNAGYAHAAANPYQDHTTCGICKPAEKPKEAPEDPDSKSAEISTEDLVIVVQSGLKCLGYQITEVNGKYNQETKDAIDHFLVEYKNKND